MQMLLIDYCISLPLVWYKLSHYDLHNLLGYFLCKISPPLLLTSSKIGQLTIIYDYEVL